MANSFIKKLFGDTSTKEIKKINPIADKIDALTEEYKKLSDAQLQAKTPEFKQRLSNGETLDDILPEAFAAIRAAAPRVLGQTPFRVQVLGGIVLHQGRIAEMKTGEGKTITATLPAYLNALTGNGVHIVTVNDYLAKYQGELMGKLYRFMGLSCGIIVHGISPAQHKEAYAADITYGTNNEFGFDYLRDNMAIYKQDMVQRGHAFCIVDEVDSILIDEARTPLIISGQGEKSTDLYIKADNFAKTLRPLRVVEVDQKESQDDIDADYIIDEKGKTATITPKGIIKAEKFFNLPGELMEPENAELLHHINQAIKARGCMKIDVDYVIKDGEIVIVDEFTGRLMFGRRYSEGLHQAIEAKENVTVNRESKTLATITFQNYFRLYGKLSGMTGTALTEEDEFRHIYGLDVIEIPTNMPMVRADNEDMVFGTEKGKFMAVIKRIQAAVETQQPVLVGTVSIEKSELLSSMLKKEGIKHQVLNAKHHEKEAGIIAQAGRPGAITIATNMAGRGTDIMLGGNAEYMAKDDMAKAGYEEEVIIEATGFADTTDETVLEARAFYHNALETHRVDTRKDGEVVLAAGGLCILGTERHESRRIDNQLRGRAGRQGDPGESTFYISLDDDLMRLFGNERLLNTMTSIMDKSLNEDEPLEHRMLSSLLESAQSNIEGRHFQSRKAVLEYDDVLNKQRGIIYDQRMQVLEGSDIKSQITAMIEEYVTNTVMEICAESTVIERLHAGQIASKFTGVFIVPEQTSIVTGKITEMRKDEATEHLLALATKFYAEKENILTPEIMRELERVVLLRTVDRYWMDHIDAMHELRQSIGLSAYAQVNPVEEYKRQGFDMFEELISEVRMETARLAFLVTVNTKREKVAKETSAGSAGGERQKPKPVKREKKVGPNDPCPCGSGKKYKKCCGQV